MNLKGYIEDLSRRVPEAQNTYVGENGLKYCAEHQKPVQVEVTLFGKTTIQNCVCSECMRLKREQEQKEKIEQKRRRVFAGTNMASWTFENDDRENAKISDALIKYAENFKEFRAEGKGILMYGGVGTGKTYLAVCIANRLLEKGYSVHVEKMTDIVDRMQKEFGKSDEIIDELARYDLLVIDDLGTERETSYMNEKIFNVFDTRYKAGRPFIVTTNLTGEEMKNPKSLEYERIYDRIFERCIFVKFEGGSRRRKTLIEEQNKYKKLLGL